MTQRKVLEHQGPAGLEHEEGAIFIRGRILEEVQGVREYWRVHRELRQCLEGSHLALWMVFDSVTKTSEEASDHHLLWADFDLPV